MEPISFKFIPLNEKGEQASVTTKKGELNDDALVLAKDTIPTGQLLRAMRRESRLVVEYAAGDDVEARLLQVVGKKISMLEQAINAVSSRTRAERRRADLESQGRAAEFRLVDCQNCPAVIDLTGFAESPEVYCQYCETISTSALEPAEARKYKLCDHCGFFSHPRGLSVFYFYFLFFFFGFSYSRKHMCGSCMRGEAWKMLILNSIFLLGLPNAIWQLGRAYFGGTASGTTFRGLEAANSLGRKRRADDADKAYDGILTTAPVLAGVSYSRALAWLHANQFDRAIEHLEVSLADCANYLPAFRVLVACYQQVGNEDQARALIALWTDNPDLSPADLAPQDGEPA